MATYKYVCVNEKTGETREVEVIKAMADYDRVELCPNCSQQMIHVLDVDGVQFMNGGGLAGTRSHA